MRDVMELFWNGFCLYWKVVFTTVDFLLTNLVNLVYRG